MRTTVERLKYLTRILATAIGGRTTNLEAAKSVLFDDGVAHVTNLEIAISIEAPEFDEMSFTVPEKELSDQLTQMPSAQPVELEY